ncbi:hypothetical protein H5410_017844 [Solanum commersonii]|uniref:Uncharacterized protein n=1 Tax=Solanum commersonii TaxID=4109 RepID=A0A9J6A1I0_SOLCO|nr:hypothetical protein H5410_017844 [Solanum commersonii]
MFIKCKMRMLRWMCGHTRSDKIRNEVIPEKVGVASVVDKLRWFGHVKRPRQDLAMLHIMTLDRKEWRSRIRLKKEAVVIHTANEVVCSKVSRDRLASWYRPMASQENDHPQSTSAVRRKSKGKQKVSETTGTQSQKFVEVGALDALGRLVIAPAGTIGFIPGLESADAIMGSIVSFYRDAWRSWEEVLSMTENKCGITSRRSSVHGIPNMNIIYFEKKKWRTMGYDEASILSKKIGEVKKRKARGLGSDHCTGCIMYGFIAASLDSSQNQEEIDSLRIQVQELLKKQKADRSRLDGLENLVIQLIDNYRSEESDDDKFIPDYLSANVIMDSIVSCYRDAWSSWGEVPVYDREQMWNHFKTQCAWYPQHEYHMFCTFEINTAFLLNKTLESAQEMNEKPDWMLQGLWARLTEKRTSEKFQKPSIQAKAPGTHQRKLEKKKRRTMTYDEVSREKHVKIKKNGHNTLVEPHVERKNTQCAWYPQHEYHIFCNFEINAAFLLNKTLESAWEMNEKPDWMLEGLWARLIEKRTTEKFQKPSIQATAPGTHQRKLEKKKRRTMAYDEVSKERHVKNKKNGHNTLVEPHVERTNVGYKKDLDEWRQSQPTSEDDSLTQSSDDDEASILSKKIGGLKKGKARVLGSEHCVGCVTFGFASASLSSGQNQEEIDSEIKSLRIQVQELLKKQKADHLRRDGLENLMASQENDRPQSTSAVKCKSKGKKKVFETTGTQSQKFVEVGMLDGFGRLFFPSIESINVIMDSIKSFYHDAWSSWGEIPVFDRELMWNHFRTKCAWSPEHDYKIFCNFELNAMYMFNDILESAWEKNQKPDWMPEGRTLTYDKVLEEKQVKKKKDGQGNLVEPHVERTNVGYKRSLDEWRQSQPTSEDDSSKQSSDEDEASILPKKIGGVKKRKASGLGSEHCVGCITYGYTAASLSSPLKQNEEEIDSLRIQVQELLKKQKADRLRFAGLENLVRHLLDKC